MFSAQPVLKRSASHRISSSPKSTLGVFPSMETVHPPNKKFKLHMITFSQPDPSEAPELLVFKADAENYKQPGVDLRRPGSLSCVFPRSFQAGTLRVTLHSPASCRLLGTSGSQPQSLKDVKFLGVRTLPVSHHLAYLK